jgi:hypothetical protein
MLRIILDRLIQLECSKRYLSFCCKCHALSAFKNNREFVNAEVKIDANITKEILC